MRGAVLKFTFHSQNTVILQEAPATWAERFALSPPMQTGQVGCGAVSTAKGTNDIWELLQRFSSLHQS